MVRLVVLKEVKLPQAYSKRLASNHAVQLEVGFRFSRTLRILLAILNFHSVLSTLLTEHGVSTARHLHISTGTLFIASKDWESR